MGGYLQATQKFRLPLLVFDGLHNSTATAIQNFEGNPPQQSLPQPPTQIIGSLALYTRLKVIDIRM
jgi:hypothetical protein